MRMPGFDVKDRQRDQCSTERRWRRDFALVIPWLFFDPHPIKDMMDGQVLVSHLRLHNSWERLSVPQTCVRLTIIVTVPFSSLPCSFDQRFHLATFC